MGEVACRNAKRDVIRKKVGEREQMKARTLGRVNGGKERRRKGGAWGAGNFISRRRGVGKEISRRKTRANEDSKTEGNKKRQLTFTEGRGEGKKESLREKAKAALDVGIFRWHTLIGDSGSP